MSLNASIDCFGAAAAVAAAESRKDGDAFPPLGALPALPGDKKASRGSTELYAFALAAPRLDGPPLTGEDRNLGRLCTKAVARLIERLLSKQDSKNHRKVMHWSPRASRAVAHV